MYFNNDDQSYLPFMQGYQLGSIPYSGSEDFQYGRQQQIAGSSAVAYLSGSEVAPRIQGWVTFREYLGGTMVCVSVSGLPPYKPAAGGESPIGPFGFHVHQNGSCEIGNPAEPFQAAGSHWNPDNQPHGNHAGDFPVLFSNNGMAWMCFYTNRFRPVDVVGKSVIIHQNPDDYRTQPAGNSGKRMACGVIRVYS